MMVVDIRKPKLEPLPVKSLPRLEPPLPHNWTAHTDQTNGMTYYYHVPTGTTQWEFPAKMKSPKKIPLLSPQTKPVTIVPDLLANETTKSTTLNKDYLELSKEYKQQRKYRDKSGSQPCLLCFRAPSSHVFFPCGHKCVCQDCLAINHFCESAVANLGDGQDKWCFCPLCNGEIKKMSIHTGHEEEDYWNWVNEIRPSLPKSFKNKLEKSKFYLEEGETDFSKRLDQPLSSKSQRISTSSNLKKRTAVRTSSKACVIS